MVSPRLVQSTPVSAADVASARRTFVEHYSTDLNFLWVFGDAALPTSIHILVDGCELSEEAPTVETTERGRCQIF